MPPATPPKATPGEKTLSTVSFGKRGDSVVYARVEDEPFVVSVPQALFDELPTDSLAWQADTIFQGDPSKVNTLEVCRAGSVPC